MLGITLIVCLNVGYYADSVSECRVLRCVWMSGITLTVCLNVGYFSDSVSECRVLRCECVLMSGIPL